MNASPSPSAPALDIPSGGQTRLASATAVDQLELALPEETPFDALGSALLNRTAEMFDLHLGMILSDHQNRWLDIANVATHMTATPKAGSTRLHKLTKGSSSGEHRCWQTEARKVDGFILGYWLLRRQAAFLASLSYQK